MKKNHINSISHAILEDSRMKKSRSHEQHNDSMCVPMHKDPKSCSTSEIVNIGSVSKLSILAVCQNCQY